MVTMCIDSNRMVLTPLNNYEGLGGVSLRFNGSNGDSLCVSDNVIRLNNSENPWVNFQGVSISNRYNMGLLRRGNILRNLISADVVTNSYGYDTSGIIGIRLSSAPAVLVDSNQLVSLNMALSMYYDSCITMTHNIISGCRQGVYAGYGVRHSAIQYNMFDLPDSVGSAIINESYDTLDARYNYWGVDGTAEITGGAGNPKNLTFIIDRYDNGGYGRVNYSGWLSATNGTPAQMGHDGGLRITDKYGFTKSVFTSGDTMYVVVTDADLDKNGLSVEKVGVRIQSGVEFNDSIWLTEVSENSDSFAGFAVMLNSGAPVYGDTALQALTGDGITVSYTDSANSYGDLVNLTQAAMFAGNAIGGYLPPGKTIWDIGGSPYIIAGNLTLNAGDTLK